MKAGLHREHIRAHFALNLPTSDSVAKKIKKDLNNFRQQLPLIHALCNPGLRQRHWDEMSEVVGLALGGTGRSL